MLELVGNPEDRFSCVVAHMATGRQFIVLSNRLEKLTFKYGVSKKAYLSLCVRKPTIWVPTRSDTNQAVQLQKQARSLKFWIRRDIVLSVPAQLICAFVFA